MVSRAKGTFKVNLSPQEPEADGGDLPIGRMLIEKEFEGDLQAKSKGQMLAFRSSVKGSAGYVAMERVTGILNGRSGTFVLQHNGTMDRGASHLTVTVAPDSGTDQLTGLSGEMEIIIADGGHSYVFNYAGL